MVTFLGGKRIMAEQQTGHEQTLILVRFLKTAVGTASYICGKGLRVDIRLVDVNGLWDEASVCSIFCAAV
jgi:hypothetical protein